MRLIESIRTLATRAGTPVPAPDDDAVRPSLRSLIALRAEATGLRVASRNRSQTDPSGAFRSPYRGRGMDFEEVRVYQPGDDIRSMDWRVTARTAIPHTKIYREERERPVLFLVDQGESMAFGTRVCFKSVIGARAAALLAWAAVDNNDRVGGIVFSEHTHCEMRPTGRLRGALHLCRALCGAAGTQRPTDSRPHEAMNEALSRLIRIARPGSIVFLLSDFRDMDAEAERHLSRLARHTDVIAIFVYDPIECHAPVPDRYEVTDGQDFLTLDTSAPALAGNYCRRFSERRDAVSRLCRRLGFHFMALGTGEPVVAALRTGLHRRATRVTRGR